MECQNLDKNTYNEIRSLWVIALYGWTVGVAGVAARWHGHCFVYEAEKEIMRLLQSMEHFMRDHVHSGSPPS